MGTLANNYVFKAIDAYPYDLEETIEALTYALSYDDKNTVALSLMGRIYAEKLCDYEKAKEYYAEALAENMYALDVYSPYIDVLLWNEDLKEAASLIDFALTVKGSDKAVLYAKKACLYEQLQQYKKALGFLKQAKKFTYNNEFLHSIKEEKERIKEKLPKKKVKTKVKGKNKKKKKK